MIIIIWRLLFLSILMASLSLNIYLLEQVKEPSAINASLNSLVANAPNPLPIKQVNPNKSTPSTLPIALSTSELSPANHPLKNVENRIKHAIDSRHYFLASNLLYEISSEDHKSLSMVKAYWLNDGKQLLKNNQYTLVKDSLDAFLAYSPDDLDFLVMWVQLRLAKQQVLLAVKKAFSLQYHTFDINLQQQSIDYAQQLVRQEIKRLYSLALWFELAKFSAEILTIAPNNTEAQWALAQAQFQQGHYALALQSLTPLLNEPNYQVKANDLVNNIELTLQHPVMIPLTRKGDHFIVEGSINNKFSVNLLIDTGASISLLSQTVFNELVLATDVNYIDDIVLTTAGGEVTSRIYEVDEFELAGYRVKNLTFAVIPYLNQENDGLLGMNFLRLFDFHIDQTNNLLRLENK